MKVALVHDWLTGFGGGEKVLQAIHDLFPAPIYTLVKDAKKLAESPFAGCQIHTSFIQNLPFAQRDHRYYLPLFPFAVEQFNFKEKDLILSCSHAVAKGIRKDPNQLHICYCFTPMRYIWDLAECYMRDLSLVKRTAMHMAYPFLRKWDLASSRRVDYFISISKHVASRIQRTYGRASSIIYPPVQTEDFFLSSQREEYYVTCSRLVSYKRVDLLVEAFGLMTNKKLVVIGDGPEMKKIRSKAKKNIELIGACDQESLSIFLSKAKAFVFAAEEDFGISVVEAQASGIPVIAFGKGGALETVIPNETGLFFSEQTPSSIIEAVNCFEKKQETFDPHKIKMAAEKFNTARFKKEFARFVTGALSASYEDYHLSRG